jgi:hypothetical protein
MSKVHASNKNFLLFDDEEDGEFIYPTFITQEKLFTPTGVTYQKKINYYNKNDAMYKLHTIYEETENRIGTYISNIIHRIRNLFSKRKRR